MVIPGFHLWKNKRVVLCAAVLTAGLMMSPLRAGSALAGLSTCGTDPVIVLSNGVVITMSATIGDDASDVQAVAYTVHVPRGVSLASVTYADAFGSIESVQVVPDAKHHSYYTTTTVTTGRVGIAVTVTSTMVAPDPSKNTSGSKVGLSGDDLYVGLDSE